MTSISLITGSTLGGAEYVAEHLESLLQQQGYATEVLHGPQLSEIPSDSLWLLISSTHGAGEVPDNLQPLLQQLQQSANLHGLRYGLIGLGSQAYDTFCQAVKTLDQVLQAKGAQRIGERLEIDVSTGVIPEDPAEVWLEQWITLLDKQ
ncbi:FMN-binding protein MioC [Plesiomonas shigelloides]|uniref:FMN-binding protein MioC n=1 Tax=Plesiomonas shigelloides TaxID=703 RepID=UPI001262A3B4|nr:FMN-binding protein MioC [Plesiomonas shigelloides]KAB7690508.1 FMN-binding protein MioC [Plesiomonas shigelloides]